MGFLRRFYLLGLPLLLCTLTTMVLGTVAAAGQEMGCQKYTNKTCEECLKNVTVAVIANYLKIKGGKAILMDIEKQDVQHLVWLNFCKACGKD